MTTEDMAYVCYEAVRAYRSRMGVASEPWAEGPAEVRNKFQQRVEGCMGMSFYSPKHLHEALKPSVRYEELPLGEQVELYLVVMIVRALRLGDPAPRPPSLP